MVNKWEQPGIRETQMVKRGFRVNESYFFVVEDVFGFSGQTMFDSRQRVFVHSEEERLQGRHQSTICIDTYDYLNEERLQGRHYLY